MTTLGRILSETCESGLTGTPGVRVTSQEVQGFKSLRLREAVLGGGLGVPYTGNPRYAGLTTRPRPLWDRAAPGKQR